MNMRLWLAAASTLLLLSTLPARAQQPTPLGPAFRIDTVDNYQRGPSTSSAANGDFVVIWEGAGASGSGIIGQRYASNGQSLGGDFLVSTGLKPTVSSAPNGDFVVVWQNASGSQDSVFARRYVSNGESIGDEFQVNTYTTASNQHPSVAVNPAGGFIVVWDANGDVFGRRYASDGQPFGGEFRVNTYTSGSNIYPAAGINLQGDVIVAWNGRSDDIFGQRYSSSGQALGMEFSVSRARSRKPCSIL